MLGSRFSVRCWPRPGYPGLRGNDLAAGVTGAAQGAAAGAAAGPYGAAAGAVVGAAISIMEKPGTTSQDGPGGEVYWTGQLRRIQAVTHDPSTPANVVAAGKALAATYQAQERSGVHWPVIPEAALQQLETAAFQAKLSGVGTMTAGFSSPGTILLLVGAVVAVGFVNMAMNKRKGRAA